MVCAVALLLAADASGAGAHGAGGLGLDILFAAVVALIVIALIVAFARRRHNRRLELAAEDSTPGARRGVPPRRERRL